MAINAISYLTGNTSYQTGMFKRGTIGANMAPLLTGNFRWWNKVDSLATQYLIYTDSYTTERTDQTNSVPVCWSTPDLNDQSLVNLINTIPERVGKLPFINVNQAIYWLQNTNKYFLLKNGYENIVTNGLVLNLDAGWYDSYPATGTVWTDLSGSGNTGTLTNGPTFNTDNGGSIVFDGSDDYVVGPNIGSLSTFTVDCWFYPTSNPNNSAAIITDIYTSYLNYVIGWGNSEVGSNTFFGGFYNDGWVKTSGITATLNQWWNLTLTFSNGELKFYSFGDLYSTTSTVKTPQGGGSGYRVGRRWDLPDYFIGKIPNIKIYNRALTETEVLQNYNAQKTRFGYANPFTTNGLVYYSDASNPVSYPGTGTTLFDLSNTSNNGNILNGVSFLPTFGGAFSFDGTDDRIEIDFPSSLPVGTSDRTIITFVKTPTTFSEPFLHVLHYGTPSQDQAFGLSVTTIFNGSSTVGNLATHPWVSSPYAPSPTLTTSTVYGLAVGYQHSNTNHYFWINGTSVSGAQNVRSINTGVTTARLGARISSPVEDWGPSGEIYLVLVYNRLLTNSEVSEVHNYFKGRYGL